MDEKYISFAELPKQSQEHLLSALGLPDDERQIIWLKYTWEYSYAEIAAEMEIGEKSVGKALSKAKRHAVKVARALYPLADEKSKLIIDTLGWRDIPWPVESNRYKVNRGELQCPDATGTD